MQEVFRKPYSIQRQVIGRGSRGLRRTAGAGGQGTNHEALGRTRTASKGVTSDERQRVIRGGRKQTYILWGDHADVFHDVGSRSKAGAAGVIPFNRNSVTEYHTLKRLKPTGPVAGKFEISR